MDANRFRRAMFAACRELGMDDETRRDMLYAVTRKRSSGALTPLERARVLDHLSKLRGHPNQGAPLCWRQGCEALGSKLAALMAAKKLPWRYITHASDGRQSMCSQLTGVDRLEFADAEGLQKLIGRIAAQKDKPSRGEER